MEVEETIASVSEAIQLGPPGGLLRRQSLAFGPASIKHGRAQRALSLLAMTRGGRQTTALTEIESRDEESGTRLAVELLANVIASEAKQSSYAVAQPLDRLLRRQSPALSQASIKQGHVTCH